MIFLINFVITTNSPGEVSAWVKPVVKEIKNNYPDSKITVFLTPCVFASGSEEKVLYNIPEIDQVYTKKDYLSYIILRKKPFNLPRGKNGIVLFLGGDLLHSVLLAKRFNYPVIAYTEGVYNNYNQIKKFLVPDLKTKEKLLNKGAEEKKVELIGNLMLDAIDVMPEKELAKVVQADGKFKITLFPGSRPAQFEYMLPFFLDAVNEFENKNISFFLSQSPFISDEKMEEICQKYLSSKDIKGRYRAHKTYKNLNFDQNNIDIEIYKDRQYYLMQISDLALTIPGTNNLELAYLGTPMLVLLPLNRPDLIPLEGLLGLIGQIPYLGKKIKGYIIPKIEERTEFVALINRIAGKEIAPEIRGILEPEVLVDKIEYYLRNNEQLKAMSKDLQKAAGIAGASKKFIQVVDQILLSYR